MTTQSSSHANFLEQPRKRKISHQEREIELLLEAAGLDRPEITDIEDPVAKRTRTASQNSALRSKSSSIQVIIRSNEPHIRRSDHPQAVAGIEIRKRGDVDTSKQDHSKIPVTYDSTQTPELTESNSINFDTIASPSSTSKSKKRKKVKHWSFPINWQKKRQPRYAREAITPKPFRRKAKLKGVLLGHQSKIKTKSRGGESTRRIIQALSKNSQRSCSRTLCSSDHDLSRVAEASQEHHQQIHTLFSEPLPKDPIPAGEEPSAIPIFNLSPSAAIQPPTEVPNMARQPEEDCNMSGVDSSPAPESKSFNLTDNCHHYQRRADVPWDIQKYVVF